VSVLDALGREVWGNVVELAAGPQAVSVGTELAAGMYVVRVVAGERVTVRRLVVE
jgi:hypothetical protein